MSFSTEVFFVRKQQEASQTVHQGYGLVLKITDAAAAASIINMAFCAAESA
jgi:hypothetical protein